MRSEADAALQKLGVGVSNVKASYEGAAQAGSAFEGRVRSTGAAGTAAGVVFGQLALTVGGRLVGAVADSVREANRLDAGLIGLSSVARAFRQDIDGSTAAAKSLAADGLMTVGEAAAGLKNLLAAGFGLPEAVTIMQRFKDSAAFGRQGSLEFGQAIVGATEGIKNGNSALVDNAGLTKNLSVILKEAGFQADDLQRAQSDVNVRTALFKGILRETNPQLGDAARYLDTAAGKAAQFDAGVTSLQQKIGKELQGALVGALGILEPFVRVLGAAPSVTVGFGVAIGSIVGPLALARTAAALGIPTFTQLGISMATVGGASTLASIRSLGDARAAIQLVGGAAGVTTSALGLMGAAAATAGVAFAAWQLGRWIAEVLDLDTKIANLTARVLGLGDVAAQEAGAKLDTMRLAVQRGADAQISYANAVKFNDEWLRKHKATLQVGSTAVLEMSERWLVQGAMLDASTSKTKQLNNIMGILGREGLRQFQRGLADGTLSAKDLIARYPQLEAGIKLLEDRLKDETEAAKKSAGETARLRTQMTGLIGDLRQIASVGDFKIDVYQMTGVGTDGLAGEVKAYQEILDLAMRARELSRGDFRLLPLGDDVGSGLTIAEEVAAIGRAFEGWEFTGPLLEDINAKTLSLSETLRTQLGPAVLSAFQGGGSVTKTIGGMVGGWFTSEGKGFGDEIQKGISGIFGKTGIGGFIGDAIGSLIPGLGTLLGPLLGKGIAKLKQLFGGPSETEVKNRSVVADFEADIQRSLTAAQRIESGYEPWKMTLIGLRDQYLAIGLSEEDAMRDAELLWSSSKQGANASALAVDQIRDRMEKAREATAAHNAEIKKAAPDYETLTKLAGDYGITLDGLGVKFQQAANTKAGEKIAKDFQDLLDAGGDAGALLAGFSDEVKDLVLQSKKFGTELPASMRDLVTHLINTKQLVDENGRAFEDISEIQFADGGIDDGLTEVNDALEDIPANAEEAARAIEDEFAQIRIDPVVVPIRWDVPELPEGRVTGAANGVYATGPTFRVFAEREPELGGPVDFMSKALAGAIGRQGGGIGRGVTIGTIDARGSYGLDTLAGQRQLARVVADAVKGELDLAGRF